MGVVVCRDSVHGEYTRGCYCTNHHPRLDAQRFGYRHRVRFSGPAAALSGQDLLSDRMNAAHYLGISPNHRNNGVIVSPCTNTEKATTATVVVTIRSRWGMSGGSANVSASANAPRRPPQHKTCWCFAETRCEEREKRAQHE